MNNAGHGDGQGQQGLRGRYYAEGKAASRNGEVQRRGGESRRWDFGNRSRNKLGTEHPGTAWKTVEQGACKSMRSKDGRLFSAAHNPKVGGSNPPPRNR